VSDESPEQVAMLAATKAVRQVLAQAKNPLTLLGRATATHVAYIAASDAIAAYQKALADERARRPAKYSPATAAEREQFVRLVSDGAALLPPDDSVPAILNRGCYFGASRMPGEELISARDVMGIPGFAKGGIVDRKARP
jgi:hypothetical protein